MFIFVQIYELHSDWKVRIEETGSDSKQPDRHSWSGRLPASSCLEMYFPKLVD